MVAAGAPLSRDALTTILVGDVRIPAAEAAFMEPQSPAMAAAAGEGLVIVIPVTRNVSHSNGTIALTQLEERVPVASSVVVTYAPTLVLIPSSTRTKSLVVDRFTVKSSTFEDNPGVLRDSDRSNVDHDTAVPLISSNSVHRSSAVCTQGFSQNVSAEPVHKCNGGRTRNKGNSSFSFSDRPCTEVIRVEPGGTHSCEDLTIRSRTGRQNSRRNDVCHDETGRQNSCKMEVCRTPNVYSTCAVGRTADVRHTPLGQGPGPGGTLSNWLRAVKPDVDCSTSAGVGDSWPPLLACRMKGRDSGFSAFHGDMDNSFSSMATSNGSSHDMVLSRCRANMENQVKSSTSTYGSQDMVSLGHHASMENPAKSYGSHEVLLDEQCWPSLRKSCGLGDLHIDGGNAGKRRTLQPLRNSNFHVQPGLSNHIEEQKRKVQQAAHGDPTKVENPALGNSHMPPMLLMVNKDFIVTSPLKENLMLTLALTEKRPVAEASNIHPSQSSEGEMRRQILVGQFKPFSSFLHFLLGRDATKVRTESNAGGTSTISESLSVEYFVRRFQAKNIVTEMEVEYCAFNWKKVDYICTLYGQRVGVSVTRAMSFPDPKQFSAQMAYRLLYKKLFGLVVARHGVSKRHSFSQCILHVWCETQETASIIQQVYDGVSQELDITDDMIMVLTVAEGLHARPIFYESILKNASA